MNLRAQTANHSQCVQTTHNRALTAAVCVGAQCHADEARVALVRDVHVAELADGETVHAAAVQQHQQYAGDQ